MAWRITATCEQCNAQVTSGRNVITERMRTPLDSDDERPTMFGFASMLREHEAREHGGQA